MNPAKIRLSATELELVTNADWILTKNAILQKVKNILEVLQAEQQDYLAKKKINFPAEFISPLPKISKGENYKGLPYLVLDHPRYFDKENVFTVRTLFWWGNFFSITLHLSGRCKELFQQQLINAYSLFAGNDFFLCINDDQWEHHFEKDNYKLTKEITSREFEQLISNKSFIKLAQKYPLQQWDEIPTLLFTEFRKIMEIVKA
ncbi:MAG: hypothetical protein JNJ86_17140 [Chitinophagaceae bacterium]|nr:hypothetical protein [Chitinophagaceae bacterium]